MYILVNLTQVVHGPFSTLLWKMGQFLHYLYTLHFLSFPFNLLLVFHLCAFSRLTQCRNVERKTITSDIRSTVCSLTLSLHIFAIKKLQKLNVKSQHHQGKAYSYTYFNPFHQFLCSW